MFTRTITRRFFSTSKAPTDKFLKKVISSNWVIGGLGTFLYSNILLSVHPFSKLTIEEALSDENKDEYENYSMLENTIYISPLVGMVTGPFITCTLMSVYMASELNRPMNFVRR